MTCWIEVGDEFVWEKDYKGARKGDTVLIRTIRIDEDGVAWVDILNYDDESEKITAEDIHEAVEKGRISKK